MPQTLEQAAVTAGMIDLDCVKLMPPSKAPATDQMTQMKKQKPYWFRDARDMTKAEADVALKRMQRADHVRRQEAVDAAEMAKIEANMAAKDAAAEKRRAELEKRHEQERQRLAARHQAQRGGW